LSMRRAVLVQISPDRSTLYRLGKDGTVYNHFRFKAANRGHAQATVILSIEDLPGARLTSMENALVVNPGETLLKEFDIGVPAASGLAPGVNHFRLAIKAGSEQDEFPETFITPAGSSQKL